MESLLNPQSNHGIMDEHLVMIHQECNHHHHGNVSNSSSSSSITTNEEEVLVEEEEEENSSSPNSPPSPYDSLQDMSSLLQHLPLKRGLSKHYNGKSRSFTSLLNVRSLEELAKEDQNSYSKKLKTCKSYGGLSVNHTCSRLIGKRQSNNKGSNFSSLIGGRRNYSTNNNNNKPPIPPPHRSLSTSGFANQTRLFA